MPTLHLICGLPGSGETTLARRLEREGPVLRFSPDEWMEPLFGSGIRHDLPRLDACRTPVESVQWEVATRALALGVDVVLEWGFWSRTERDDYRSRGEALGARVELHFLDVPRDELWARLAKRNAALTPGTFHIEERQLDLWLSGFEPPAPDELT
jgi:hypothetical protein